MGNRIYESMNAAAADLWRVVPRESVINELLTIYRPHAEAVAAKFSSKYQWFGFDEFLGAATEKQWRLALRFDPDKGTQFTSLCHTTLAFACMDLLRSSLPMGSKVKARMEAAGKFVTTSVLAPKQMAEGCGGIESPDNGEHARRALLAEAEVNKLFSEIDPAAAELLSVAMKVDFNVDQIAKAIGKTPKEALAMLESATRNARYGEPYAPRLTVTTPKKTLEAGTQRGRMNPQEGKAA